MMLFLQKDCRDWNPHVDKLTDILFLPLSVHDEMTVRGTGRVVVELLADSGLLVPRGGAEHKYTGPWDLHPGWETKRIFLYGDAKSIMNYRSFYKTLGESSGTHRPFSEAYEQSVQLERLVDRLVPIPGDWHFGLNVLIAIFKLYWGGFLQVFSVLLNLKRLTEDPTEHYQAGRVLVLTVHSQVERLLLDRYSASFGIDIPADIRSALNDFASNRFLGLRTKSSLRKKTFAYVVSFMEGYSRQLHEWSTGDDELYRVLCSFVQHARDFRSFVVSCKCGCGLARSIAAARPVPGAPCQCRHRGSHGP